MFILQAQEDAANFFSGYCGGVRSVQNINFIDLLLLEVKTLVKMQKNGKSMSSICLIFPRSPLRCRCHLLLFLSFICSILSSVPDIPPVFVVLSPSCNPASVLY
jgi:hypothetical protein